MLSKKERLRKHLKAKGSITPLESLSRFGLYRLGARILELRAEGMDIETHIINVKGSKFARYVLIK